MHHLLHTLPVLFNAYDSMTNAQRSRLDQCTAVKLACYSVGDSGTILESRHLTEATYKTILPAGDEVQAFGNECLLLLKKMHNAGWRVDSINRRLLDEILSPGAKR